MRRFAVLVGVMALAASSLVVALASQAGAGNGGNPISFLNPALNGDTGQPYTVPDGVCQVTIDAIGARGGNGGSNPALAAHQGGLGGQAIATIDVTPFEVLHVFVGGRGQDVQIASGQTTSTGGAGGINGGAAGGTTTQGAPTDSNRLQSGAGGGGGSDVRQGGFALADRVVVGGGGGGAGASSTNTTIGGTGGGTTGGNGQAAAQQANPGLGGQQTFVANGGVGQGGGASGGNGQLGVGGTGATGAGAGGGGGGGWFGGGGAGAKTGFSGAGGGGGSGFVLTGSNMTNGVDANNSGNGRVTITPALPGVGCPSTLQVRKVVKGDSEDGFTIHVTCARGGVEADLRFNEDGSPAPPGLQGWTVVDGAWQLQSRDLGTCTATETKDGDADSVRYTCEYTFGVQDGYKGAGCPGPASGPSSHPLSVTFEGNNDRGVLTVTNKFEDDPDEEVVVTPPPPAAQAIAAAPAFTG